MLSLDQYIDRVQTLPPAPRILPRLLALLREENVPPQRIVDLITFDPALTASVLQRCNTVEFSAAERTHDLALAISRLGYNVVYRLVATVLGESTLSGIQAGYGLAYGELWQHSVATAVAARLLAKSLAGDENLVFTAALLHDVGKLVLNGFLADSQAAIWRETEISRRSFLEVEQLLLGVDHATVGARLLATWNFPDNLVKAVGHHHHPAEGAPFEQLAAFVHVGDMIAHMLGHGHGYQSFAVRVHGEVLDWLEIDSRQVETLTLQTESALGGLAWFAPKAA